MNDLFEKAAVLRFIVWAIIQSPMQKTKGTVYFFITAPKTSSIRLGSCFKKLNHNKNRSL